MMLIDAGLILSYPSSSAASAGDGGNVAQPAQPASTLAASESALGEC